MRRFLRELAYLLPAAYLVGAALVWFDFAATNPDGLANSLIVLYTFPVAAVATYALGLEFPYFAGGYLEAHALYFWPSAVGLAVLLHVVLRAAARQPRLQP